MCYSVPLRLTFLVEWRRRLTKTHSVESCQLPSCPPGVETSPPRNEQVWEPYEKSGSWGSGTKMTWCVVQLVPGGEDAARKLLGHLEVPVHQFMVAQQPRRKPPVMVPAFPGYLFVDLDLSTNVWKMVNSLDPIVRLLGASSGTPVGLKPGQFELIGEFLRCNYQLPTKLECIPVGAEVEICVGPLAELQATCVESNSEVVKVLMDIMGRKVHLQVQRSSVKMMGVARPMA